MTNKLYSTTITVKGLKTDVDDFLKVAKRYGVALEEITSETTPVKASKGKKATGDDNKQIALIESYKASGCYGYYIDNDKIIPVAKYDTKNACYWLAKVARGKVSTDDKGRVITLYDDTKYHALQKSYLDGLHSKHQKAPKYWKRDKVYKVLGYLVDSKLEASIIAF